MTDMIHTWDGSPQGQQVAVSPAGINAMMSFYRSRADELLSQTALLVATNNDLLTKIKELEAKIAASEVNADPESHFAKTRRDQNGTVAPT